MKKKDQKKPHWLKVDDKVFKISKQFWILIRISQICAKLATLKKKSPEIESGFWTIFCSIVNEDAVIEGFVHEVVP